MTSENCDLSAACLMENPKSINCVSSAECLEKATSVVHKTQNKQGHESHIPRSLPAESNSFNAVLKNYLNKSKGRPSMIPKSKSVRRIEKGNVKIESSMQCEEIPAGDLSNTNELTYKTDSDEAKKIIIKRQRRENQSEERKRENLSHVTKPKSKEDSENLETEISCTSLKSCVTEFDIKDERLKASGYSAASMKSQLSVYKDAEEGNLGSCLAFDHNFAEGEKAKAEKEVEKQEKGIRTLYETLKSTGPNFDDFKWICGKNQQENTSAEDWQNFSVQKCYDVTLEEISDVWKSTMSLISSVKDHAVRLIEDEEANSLDKEQLMLESEMVQLAIDFAINYSKLKTDSLIKSVGKRLGVENLTKTSLEEFMDSKTFPAMYNDEDLATMSRTIKDLNENVLKGEDIISHSYIQTCRNFTNPFSRWCL